MLIFSFSNFLNFPLNQYMELIQKIIQNSNFINNPQPYVEIDTAFLIAFILPFEFLNPWMFFDVFARQEFFQYSNENWGCSFFWLPDVISGWIFWNLILRNIFPDRWNIAKELWTLSGNQILGNISKMFVFNGQNDLFSFQKFPYPRIIGIFRVSIVRDGLRNIIKIDWIVSWIFWVQTVVWTFLFPNIEFS